MDQKDYLQRVFFDKIEINYTDLIKYYETDLMEFCELNKLKNEVVNCLLIELSQAAIYTTSHLFERTIKLALIKYHTIDFDYSNTEQYNLKIEEAINLYDCKILNTNIETAYHLKLISDKQQHKLKELKNDFRNPFAHAEVSKVNNELPKTFNGFTYNLVDVKNRLANNKPLTTPKEEIISTHSPAIAQYLFEEQSNKKAFKYFKEIFDILIHFENKISLLKKQN